LTELTIKDGEFLFPGGRLTPPPPPKKAERENTDLSRLIFVPDCSKLILEYWWKPPAVTTEGLLIFL